MVLIVPPENENRVINQLQEFDNDTKIYKIECVIEKGKMVMRNEL